MSDPESLPIAMTRFAVGNPASTTAVTTDGTPSIVEVQAQARVIHVCVVGWWRVTICRVQQSLRQNTQMRCKPCSENRTQSGTCKLSICSGASVKDLRAALFSSLRIPEDKQRLFINGLKAPADNKVAVQTLMLSGDEQLRCEIFDLRYLEQILSKRLPPGFAPEGLFSTDLSNRCILISHRKGCNGVGCTSTTCVKAGAGIHLSTKPRDGTDTKNNESLRKYQVRPKCFSYRFPISVWFDGGHRPASGGPMSYCPAPPEVSGRVLLAK